MNIVEDNSIPDYPMYLYIFNADGMHNGKVTIKNEAELVRYMETDVKKAMWEGREVRITDVMDNLCWHAEHGKVVWPPADQK